MSRRSPAPRREGSAGESARELARGDGRRTRGAAPARRRGRRRPSDVSEALYVAPSELHGLGLFAAEPLSADTVLGRLLGMPTFDDGMHVLWLSDEIGLEVINDFRFINHSETPNCALTEVDVVTLRAIEQGEELTHDYGWGR